MTKKRWRNKIVAAMQEVGTYRESFKATIDTLAGIMELRDDAWEKFNESGAKTVIEVTGSTGFPRLVKNPELVVVDDLNKTALAYWRDLGLTPAGLKRVNDQAMKENTVSGFAEIVGKIFAGDNESE